MPYQILQNEYLELSIQSKDFKENKEFKLDTLLNRYMTHSDGQVTLDIGRDHRYFNDVPYDIKEYQRPKVEKDCSDKVNPYKERYER